MDRRFEKTLLILMILSAFFLLMADSTLAVKELSTGQLQNQHPGITRFHVIANSDSEEDQNLKLQVRDYVLDKLQRELAEEVSKPSSLSNEEVIKEYIGANLSRIESWASEEIKNRGYSYTCSVSLGIKHIPAKYYDDLFFPEGNYETLTITIGKGLGQNWWCVVFPPLCLIDSEDSSYKDQLSFDQSEKVVLKSKIKELLTASIHKWV